MFALVCLSNVLVFTLRARECVCFRIVYAEECFNARLCMCALLGQVGCMYVRGILRGRPCF